MSRVVRSILAMTPLACVLASAPVMAQHAGHDPAAPTGMDHSKMDHSKMDHSKMDHSKMDHSKMDHSMHRPPAPAEPRTPIPPVTESDRAAAFQDLHEHHMHDGAIVSRWMLNRLEGWNAEHGSGMGWEGSAWIGGDINKLLLRSEGERVGGITESANLEVLYSRGVTAWWDLVAGVRHDFQPGGSQNFAAIGFQGLAPMKFEMSATAYVGEGGQTAASVEAEYELLLTNRLILQPMIEVEAYGKDDARRGIGSGISTADAGLRLRYELSRKFAPYIGVVHERSFGRTADFRRAHGERSRDTSFVLGVRAWF